jgi:hypothetical protein
MKLLKMIGLLVTAISALLALAGSAYATPTLTSPAGNEYTGEFHMTQATPNSARLEAGILDTCGESTLKGTIETNNETVGKGKISSLTFGDCTRTTNVLSSVGSLEIASGGVVTAIGTEWTVLEAGISCVYGFGSGTKLGTLAGGAPATLTVNTTKLPKVSGGIFCAKEGTWKASYTFTTPGELLVD